MKHFDGKIKKEHNILKEFKDFLKQIEKIKEIKKIIPWRISRKQSWSSLKKISFSYYTSSWLKLICKKWSTAQEIFVVIKKPDKENVKQKIIKIIELNKLL